MNAYDLLRATRNNIARLCDGLSSDQLNHIPEGFNNNLIWNAGHVIATMELLTYGLTDLRTPSGRDFINRYRKGTKPDAPADEVEIAHVLKQLTIGVAQLEADTGKQDFSNFKAYQTSYGVELKDIDDALAFNNMHEAMHVGSMLALRKFVG